MNDEIKTLAHQLHEWLNATSIDELELNGPGTFIHLQKTAQSLPDAPHPASASQALDPMFTLVRAGSVGTVLHTHPLREDPLLQAGQSVCAGQTVALLKIGTVLLPVPSPHDGTVLRILAEHGSIVGYGDGLVEIMKEKHHAN